MCQTHGNCRDIFGQVYGKTLERAKEEQREIRNGETRPRAPPPVRKMVSKAGISSEGIADLNSHVITMIPFRIAPADLRALGNLDRFTLMCYQIAGHPASFLPPGRSEAPDAYVPRSHGRSYLCELHSIEQVDPCWAFGSLKQLRRRGSLRSSGLRNAERCSRGTSFHGLRDRQVIAPLLDM